MLREHGVDVSATSNWDKDWICACTSRSEVTGSDVFRTLVLQRKDFSSPISQATQHQSLEHGCAVAFEKFLPIGWLGNAVEMKSVAASGLERPDAMKHLRLWNV